MLQECLFMLKENTFGNKYTGKKRSQGHRQTITIGIRDSGVG